MSLLQTTLDETLAVLPANGLAELATLIDPAWIEHALGATGKASIRRRKLPAEHAVWLVIGLALFRHMPRQGVLRSKQPELVMQEVWGVLIAHTLLRRWMRLMAQHVGVAPTRISFHTAQHAIVGALNTVHLARAGTLPQHLQRLLEQARYFVLPPRRTDRSFPREVKRSSRSKYPSKKCQSGLTDWHWPEGGFFRWLVDSKVKSNASIFTPALPPGSSAHSPGRECCAPAGL